jgi:hypothetical protein
VVEVVQLEEVIRAAKAEGHADGVVDGVAGDLAAAAFDADTDAVDAALDGSNVGDVIVFGEVVAGLALLGISTFEDDAAGTGIVDFTAADGDVGAAGGVDGGEAVADMAHSAAGDAEVGAAVHFEGAVVGALDLEPLEAEVAGVFEAENMVKEGGRGGFCLPGPAGARSRGCCC